MGLCPECPSRRTYIPSEATNKWESLLVSGSSSRESLSNWMGTKRKSNRKTVQGISRHAKIQTTLDLYTQEDGDETLAAQEEYLTALGVAPQLDQ